MADTDNDTDLDIDLDTDSDTDVDSDTDIDTDVDTDIDIDTDTDTDDDDNPFVRPFELPRKDWYDEDGRIYKDALIENFNAIETKILELTAIDTDDITIPDLNNIEYENYTESDLTDVSKETKILNLKSFIDICHLANFPLVIEVSGTKIKKLEFYDSNYNYSSITSTVSATESEPYLFLDISTKEIYKTDTFNTTDVLVGVLKDNKLVTANTLTPGNVNFQKVLADQAKKYAEYATTKGDKEVGTWGDTNRRFFVNNQTVYYCNGATNAGGTFKGGTDLLFLNNTLRTEPELEKQEEEND